MGKISFIVLLMTSVNLYSQVFDWQQISDIKSAKLEVKDGSFSSFSITNINRFIYNVSISGQNVTIQTQAPAELQTLFRLPTADPTEPHTEIANELKSVADLSTTITPQTRKSLKGTPKQKSEAEAELTKEIKEFNEKLKEYKTQALKTSNEIYNLKIAKIQLVNAAQMDISYDAMKINVGAIIVNNPSQEYNKLLTDFAALQTLYDALKTKITEDAIKDIFEKIESSHKNISEQQVLELFSDCDYLKTQLLSEKNFNVVAPPVQADGDFINYQVVITPVTQTKLSTNRSPTSFKFDIPVKGGLKVDFSVGPVFSFGKNSKNDKFYFESNATDPEKVTLKQRGNENWLTPGVAAMMHVYKRTGKWASWGGLFGIGAGFQSIEDADVSFYGGLSYIMGKKQKVMLNAGISILGVERLKAEEYVIGNQYLSSVTLNDVTEKVFKSSFFISVSYNLASRSED